MEAEQLFLPRPITGTRLHLFSAVWDGLLLFSYRFCSVHTAPWRFAPRIIKKCQLGCSSGLRLWGPRVLFSCISACMPFAGLGGPASPAATGGSSAWERSWCSCCCSAAGWLAVKLGAIQAQRQRSEYLGNQRTDFERFDYCDYFDSVLGC